MDTGFLALNLKDLFISETWEGREWASVTFLGHTEEGGDGETGYALRGEIQGGLQQRPLPGSGL